MAPLWYIPIVLFALFAAANLYASMAFAQASTETDPVQRHINRLGRFSGWLFDVATKWLRYLAIGNNPPQPNLYRAPPTLHTQSNDIGAPQTATTTLEQIKGLQAFEIVRTRFHAKTSDYNWEWVTDVGLGLRFTHIFVWFTCV